VQLQNGAPTEGDVAQLVDLEDDDGYRVEVRQETEQTSYTVEHVQQQPDGTDEVSTRTLFKAPLNSYSAPW